MRSEYINSRFYSSYYRKQRKFTLFISFSSIFLSVILIAALSFKSLSSPGQKTDPGTSFAASIIVTGTILCPLKTSGDANCDGVVNDKDLAIWKNEFTLLSKTKNANFNGDAFVNHKDYRILIAHMPNASQLTKPLSSVPAKDSYCAWCGMTCIPRSAMSGCPYPANFHQDYYACVALTAGGVTRCATKGLDVDGVALN